MNRRKFVGTLGSSLAAAGWKLSGRELLGKLSSGCKCRKSTASGQSIAGGIWPRPVLAPLPKEVPGIAQPITDLGGIWKLTTSPPEEFWQDSVSPDEWTEITVPGELAAQGIVFARDNEFVYKRLVEIPTHAAGKTILLRFDGVYSYARIWVNGKFLREHHGGFTSWDCDITEHTKPGRTAWLTVGVTDRADEISYASNYAKHYIGGILRSVKLVILPAVHISRLHVETDFDATLKDARLKVAASVAGANGQDVKLRLRLTDPATKGIPTMPSTMTFSAANPETSVEIPVSSPVKWDAEHPNLYTLEAELIVQKTAVERLEKKIGFRQVERRKNELYVNGDPVKLRGVCRHDTHPLWGRMTSPEQDEKDAILLRDANVNFVRTSHYPPTESFLEACDRNGIYVEEESAVCFVQQGWSVSGGGTQSDPKFTSRYMNQFAEMIARDRSHACVIFWSLGNESAWGTNFQKEHDYAKQEDPSRPVIFSYGETVPQGADGYDLLSKHYPEVAGDLTSKEFPKLNDEYGHVSCYNTETLKRDPGVRSFWGRSLKEFWENAYASDGCLGGAIWAGFEEVFMLPKAPVGYGEWGIVDGWRRPKPEYWLTKKGYSPVRVADEEITTLPATGTPLEIPIKNWFNHTNLNELKILWSVGGDAGEIRGLNLRPSQEGTMTIPARAWQSGDTLNLKFIRAGEILVDEFNLRIGKRAANLPREQGPAPKISADAHAITVQGVDFKLEFAKATGLITEGTFRGQRIIEGGPTLNLGSVALPPWWLTGISYSTTPETALIKLAGAYMARQGGGEVLGVEFEIRIDGQGLITAHYALRSQPKGMSEVGIGFTLASSIDRLSWDRKALWSAYPADHIGRPEGTAMRGQNGARETYRSQPNQPWSQDSKDFFLFGPEDPGGRGSHDFRSLKENIWHASCALAGTNLCVRAESDASDAVRVEVFPDGRVQFNIDNLWGYPDLAWGNDSPPPKIEPGYTNSVRMRLTETSQA